MMQQKTISISKFIVNASNKSNVKLFWHFGYVCGFLSIVKHVIGPHFTRIYENYIFLTIMYISNILHVDNKKNSRFRVFLDIQ